MVSLGLELEVAGWKVQTKPLSYGGTPSSLSFCTAHTITIAIVGDRT